MSLAHLITQNNQNQLRQYTDAAAVFEAHTRAIKEAASVRGSMFWRELRGVRYLIRSSAAGAQTSLGADSEQTQAIYTKFMERKERVELSRWSLTAYFSPSWTAFQVDGGRDFNVVVEGVSV